MASKAEGTFGAGAVTAETDSAGDVEETGVEEEDVEFVDVPDEPRGAEVAEVQVVEARDDVELEDVVVVDVRDVEEVAAVVVEDTGIVFSSSSKFIALRFSMDAEFAEGTGDPPGAELADVEVVEVRDDEERDDTMRNADDTEVVEAGDEEEVDTVAVEDSGLLVSSSELCL